jgi:hypothetical protein
VNAAIARNQYPAAEQMVREGQRKYPNYKGWDDLQKRVADGRKAWQVGPDGKPVGAADNRPDRRDGPNQQNAAKVRDLLAAAKLALAGGKLSEAETSLKQAEQLAPDAPDVRAARADLDKQKAAAAEKANNDRIVVLVGQSHAAIQKNDFAAADKALDAAEKIDAKAVMVVSARAELDAAKKKASDDQAAAAKVRELLTATQRDAAAGKLTEAETSLRQAEAIAPNAPEVKKARADLDRLKREAATKNPGVVPPGTTGATPPSTTGGTTPPAPGPATPGTTTAAPPAGATPPATPPATTATPAANPRLVALVAQARDAIKKEDFKAADKALDAAEKIDAKAPDVIAARAEYNAARKADRPRRNN